jgi:hypothetical protein
MAGKKGRSGTNGAGKTAPKRSKEKRLLDRAEMVHLLREGCSKGAIAAKLGVHATQISYDWKIVVKELAGSRDRDLDELIAIKLEEYGHLKREAWAAWHQSKVEVKPLCVPDEKTGKPTIKYVETFCPPNPAFLGKVLECLNAERVLLAINPPKEVSVKGAMSSVNWDLLASGLPPDGQECPDEVELQIARILDRQASETQRSPSERPVNRLGYVPWTNGDVQS